jgi:hypothetical protein
MIVFCICKSRSTFSSVQFSPKQMPPWLMSVPQWRQAPRTVRGNRADHGRGKLKALLQRVAYRRDAVALRVGPVVPSLPGQLVCKILGGGFGPAVGHDFGSKILACTALHCP